MGRTCTLFLLMLLICRVSAADDLTSFETYNKPKAFVLDGKAHLMVQVSDGGGSSSAVYRNEPSGWARLAEFNADYSAMALNGSNICLFLPNSVIEIETRHWQKVSERRWPFNWRPQSAEIVDGGLVAFGVSGDKRMYCAEFVRAGVDSANRPTRTPATSAAAPATDSQKSGEWREVPIEPNRPNCTNLCTMQSGGSIWVFWSELSQNGMQDLRSARLDGGTLRDQTLVQTVKSRPNIAAVNFNGEPAIIYTAGDESSAPTMLFRRNINGHWTPLVEVQNVTGGQFESIVGIDATVIGNDIHAFLATNFRTVQAVYNGVTWSRSQAVLCHPAVAFTLEHLPYIYAGCGLAFLLLVVSYVRSRFLPARAIIDGFDYVLAPFWRRACAYLFDLAIIISIVVVVQQVSGETPGRAGIAVMIFCIELLYFSLSEGRAGRTLGKRLFGIFVISRNGGYASISEAFIRNLPRAVVDAVMWSPIGWLVAALFILNSKGSQRVGDILAGTYVVKERPPK